MAQGLKTNHVDRRENFAIEDTVQFMLKLAHSQGYPVGKESKVLDFGCGIGDSVNYLVENGYDAYGVDVMEYWSADFENYWEKREKPAPENCERLSRVDMANYRIPFPDETFDFIFSDTVFEHVFNYEMALSEINRVLKKGKLSIHMFPSALCFKEPHIFVPIVPLCKKNWWLKIWALAGIRGPWQKNLNWRETVIANAGHLKTTNYLPKAKILEMAKSADLKISFIGGPMPLNHLSSRSRKIHGFLNKFGAGDFATSLVRPFVSGRLMVLKK
ncbi:MAG: class I SAM-dependent methyltransferase [Nitrospiraceae bacterium]|nr:class I SAM-dependent methyltransferase [Nitrospiraceae bacterium]